MCCSPCCRSVATDDNWEDDDGSAAGNASTILVPFKSLLEKQFHAMIPRISTVFNEVVFTPSTSIEARLSCSESR